MGSFCDFCGGQRSMVYCRSDAASLCLSCDRSVHSANALSRRHSRTLLCDRCYAQPATVRYIEERISLCQNCENEHGNSTSSSERKRQTINCYSGCPSATELARIWPFVLQFSSITISSCDQGIKGLMSINENRTNTYWEPLQQSSTADMSDICSINDVKKLNTTNVHIASSTCTATLMIGSTDQPANSTDSSTPKSSDGRVKKVGNSEDDFYDGFAEDDELTFENYEVLFGSSQAHSESIFDDVGIDSIFEIKKNSSANSNCQDELVAEASSGGQVKSMQIAISNAVSDSVMPNQGAKADYNISVSARQAHSSLSLTFSSLTGESSAGDYQDCGMSSMPCMGEQPPWCPTSSNISVQATNRDNAVMRYKEKKKARKFEKKIRYASRKTRADSRRRVKGRFVKAGEAFDYDPLCQA